MQVLAGDIGGTKTLLAIAEVSDAGERGGAPRVDVLESRRFDSNKFPGLAAISRVFAEELGRPLPRTAGFGIAGPVDNGRCQATNLPWVIDEAELASTLGLSSVRLANDFYALALGIPAVRAKDLVTLNEGVRDPKAPWVLIGAGTGLGEAICTPGPGGRQIIATEGGHTDFAPRSELEIGVLRFLSSRWEHVSWERVVSGDGLVNLSEALAHLSGMQLPPELALAARSDRAKAPALVTAGAQAGDPLCRQVVELFCRLYGAEAGNLALKTLATGGVYVAGGIAPRILDFLTGGGFREAFLAKGRMRVLLERMPVQVVLDTDAGLLGAAILAAQTTSLST
jgi:glucokinase